MKARTACAALRVVACSRAGSPIAQVSVGSLRPLRVGYVEVGALEGRRYCGGGGACSAGREALAEAFAEIPAADAGGLGLVGGVRVRCAVLGVAAEVAGLCVGVGNFVLAVVMLIVNAGVAVHVAAAVLARVAALGIASYIFPVCSVGCGLGSGNCVVSAVVRAWRSAGRMCPTRCALNRELKL